MIFALWIQQVGETVAESQPSGCQRQRSNSNIVARAIIVLGKRTANRVTA